MRLIRRNFEGVGVQESKWHLRSLFVQSNEHLVFREIGDKIGPNDGNNVSEGLLVGNKLGESDILLQIWELASFMQCVQ